MNISQYIRRDFKYRKSEIRAALIAMIIINALISFLLILGENFEINFINVSSSSWLFQFIANYLVLILILSFIIGFFIFYNIFTGMIVNRQKEIGTIKAIGGDPAYIKSVLLWEIIFITLIGVFLGIFFGILGYEIFYFIVQYTYFINFNIPVWSLFFQFLLYLFLSWFFGGLQITLTYRKSVATLLSDEIELEERYSRPQKTKTRKIRFGLAYKFASKSYQRHRKSSNRLFINMMLGMFLISISLMGSILFEFSTLNYQKNAMDEHILIVGQKDMVFQYCSRLVLYQMHVRSFLNYSQDNYLLNSSIISDFESIPCVLVDPRLIFEFIVQEVPYVEGYTQIGQSRILSSFIIGAHPEKFIPDIPLVNGIPFRAALFLSGPIFVISGDWLAKNLLYDSNKENLIIQVPNQKIPNFVPIYRVLGICSDPLNGGNILYMNINHLQNLTGVNAHNLLLIKIFFPTSILDIANKLQTLGPDYIMLGTDWFLNNNLNYTQFIWIPFLILPFLFYFIILFNLIASLNSSIERQLHDFGMLRVLGAKSSTIKKTIFIRSFFEILLPSSLGIFMGAMVTIYLIYTYVFSFLTLLLIAIGIFLTIFPLALVSTYPAFKIAKQSDLKSLIHP